MLALALLGAGIGAGAWLLGHWHERERLWRWAREASRGLALASAHLLRQEPEANHHNGYHHIS
jgi:hypothetical protein